MKGYKPLKQVLPVIHSRHPGDEIEITGADGEATYINPSQLKNLPGLLRNSIAHFNILPIGKEGGRFAGVRVWNRAIDGQLTFVADINFDELRSMARHVLMAVRHQREDIELRDPPDPMDEVRSQRENPPRLGKAPKINGEIWDQFVEGRDGDHVASKISLDRWMKKEADRLRLVGKASGRA
jgi:hypothetical protein